MRIGGEYRGEGGRDRTLWHARTIFLEQVAEWVPEALEELRDKVLPAYRAAYEATQPPPTGSGGHQGTAHERPPELVQWSFQEGHWDRDGVDWPEELVAFREGLLAWAERWNLREGQKGWEPWMLDAALRTLHGWYEKLHRPDLADMFPRTYSASDTDEALDELREHVLPAFQKTVEATTSDESPRPDWLSPQGLRGQWTQLPAEPPELRTLRDAIGEWAVGHVLPAPELMDAVLEVLRDWADVAPKLRFRVPPVVDVADHPAFEFEFPAWTPRWTSESEYRRELKSAFKRELHTYMQERKAEAEEQGLDPSPEKLGQLGEGAEQHFEWLVWFQVREQELTEIADATGRAEPTVQEAIHRTADLVGITRRSLL